MRSILAALRDLTTPEYRMQVLLKPPEPGAMEVSRNRAAVLLLGIYHLKDDVKCWARALGWPKSLVDDFCSASTDISLCIKAGDTFKHGVGGRSGNFTVMNHFAVVEHKLESSQKLDLRLVMPLVVDETGWPHQADTLARSAMRAWSEFLRNQFALDVGEWEQFWREPTGKGVWEAELPPQFADRTKEHIDALRSTSKRKA